MLQQAHKKKVYEDIKTINNEKLCIIWRKCALIGWTHAIAPAIFKKSCKIKMVDIMQMLK